MAPIRKPGARLRAQETAHGFEALSQLAVTVQIGHAAGLEGRVGFLHPDEHAGQSHPRQVAGAIQRDEDDLVVFAVPLLPGPASQMPSADQPGLVIVGAEVGGPRVRDFQRDQRNPRIAVFRGHDRRDVLVGLEFDDEIHLLAHQDVGVPLRDLGVVAVVDADQLQALRGRRALQAGRDLLGELIVGALRRISQTKGPLLERPLMGSVQVLAHLLEHPAALERVEQAEGHALGQPAARRDFTERQRLTGGAERRKQL